MTGAELIAAERERQVSEEGYDPKHDDSHRWGEMAYAAATYILCTAPFTAMWGVYWPWDSKSWKPAKSRLRNLVKAGALIAAEIDRLERKAL